MRNYPSQRVVPRNARFVQVNADGSCTVFEDGDVLPAQNPPGKTISAVEFQAIVGPDAFNKLWLYSLNPVGRKGADFIAVMLSGVDAYSVTLPEYVLVVDLMLANKWISQQTHDSLL